jgi:hypothetical protein
MSIATREPRQVRSLPRDIRRGLSRVKLRLRAVGAMRGLGKTAIVLAVGAALAMAADMAVVMPMPIRWTLWGLWTTAAAVALLAGFVRPLFRRLNWIELAALAERGQPELGERLASAVGLLRQRTHGSPELISALVDDAAGRASRLDLARVVSARAAIAWVVAGGLASALVVVPAVLKPDPFARIGKRFIAPWAGTDRVGFFAIDVEPGDKVVASGSNVIVSVTVRSRLGLGLPRDPAWVKWRTLEGPTTPLLMDEVASAKPHERSFAVTIPSVTGSLRYHADFAGTASQPHLITVVDLPAVARVQAQVEPPAYTGRMAGPASDPARIDAWEESRVTLEIEATRPVKEMEVIWPQTGHTLNGSPHTSKESPGTSDHRVVPLQGSTDGKRWSATVVAQVSGPYSINMRDRYDLANKPDLSRRVIVRADAPPTLNVLAPDEFKETNPNDYLRLGVAARDDVAVASAELHYSIERSPGAKGPTAGSVPALLAGLGTPRARGEAGMSLAALSLQPGDILSYRVRVADNRPGPRGPQFAWSPTYVLKMIEHSEPLGVRQETAEREALRARLEAIQKAAATNQQQAEQLRYRADEVRRGHGAWDEARAGDLAARESATREGIDQLQILSRDLDGHETFHPLARPARQVAEVESQGARTALELARRATDPADRQAALEQAGTRLRSVSGRVDELKRRFDELARHDDDRRKLATLSQREDALAQRAEQAVDRAGREAVATEQEQLRRELDEVLKSSPTLQAAMLAAQAQEAEALAARARALADLQREEARRTADQGPRSNAVTALAEKQRALEDDARRVAVRIDEPLAQNGRARADVDVLARAGDAIERGDLDSARDRAQEAENALERLGRDVEDAQTDPKALARRLVQRQDHLKNETVEAVRESRDHPPQTAEGKAALADRLRPLIERQEAIARLAAALPVPPAQRDAARDAIQKTAVATEDLRAARPRDVEGHQNEARDALNRLAEALPDPNQRRDQARQKVAEARSRSEEIARDLERHLRETAPKPGQSLDFARSAAELAERVAPLASRERELAAALRAIEPESRVIPQRDRAARRADEFAQALEAVKRQAPTAAALDTKPDEPRPLATWHVVGPFAFDSGCPFSTEKGVDPRAKFNDLKGQPTAWKPAEPVDRQGTIDLGRIYGRDLKQAAFALTEIASPFARSARVLIGSDDTLTVWLNGKSIYDFRGERSHSPATDRLDVALSAGVNRIVVKCGNTNGDWKFSVAVTPPPEVYRPITHWRVIGPFASGAKPPVAVDSPIDLTREHTNRQGKPASWLAAKPVNDKGAIDLAGIYATRDNGVAAFGYAELDNPASRPARMLIGSNDTFTVWLNGKQVYDSQIGRSWAPDQARIDVPLAAGKNRLLVKCGNTGGNWMYSLAVSADPAPEDQNRANDLAGSESELEQLRAALPAIQLATKAALERLQQKLDGHTPADRQAAALAADQADLKAAEEKAPTDDAATRAALAADQRRIASALADLDAPDDPLAQAESVERALEAVRALDAPANDHNRAQAKVAINRAVEAATVLARRLGDEPSPQERIQQLARLQRKLLAADAQADRSAQAREQRAIGNELARLPVEHKDAAVRAVGAAALLSDQSARLDPGPRPDAAALSIARERASVALDKLAAASDTHAPAAGGVTRSPGPASPLNDPALGLTPADRADALALARRQRHIRESLQAIVGAASASQKALRDRSATLGREVADLRDRAQAISSRAPWSATAAADLLGRSAPETMDRAITGLHRGRPGEAVSAQRQAADQAEQAARHAEDTAAALRADPPPGPVDRAAGNLAAAQAAARSASEHLTQARTAGQSAALAAQAAAAAAMRRAAQVMRSTAPPARGPARPGQPTSPGTEPRTALADHGSPDLSDLKAAVRLQSGRTWGQLPGHLRNEILQMAQGRYRDEYARLIELYFREIAADAADQRPRP